MLGSSSGQHGHTPISREITAERVNADVSDLLNELITEYVYRTEADLETVDRKVDAQAAALVDLQCKLQDVVSQMALLSTSVVIGDPHSQATGGGQAVSTEQRAVGKRPEAAGKYNRSSSSNNTADSDFLRNWVNTFRPVEEEQIKRQLHRCKVEVNQDIEVAVQKLKEEVTSALTGCLEISAKAEANARSSAQETRALVTRARLDLVRQNIECVTALDTARKEGRHGDAGSFSNLLRKLRAQEEEENQELSGLGFNSAVELKKQETKNSTDPLCMLHGDSSPHLKNTYWGEGLVKASPVGRFLSGRH